MSLTVGSLFSGIGGLDLGLERAGMTVRWQSEIDPYCSRVLAKHWPGVPNLGDVKEIVWEDVERVDLVCGGYPCQPFSVAGARRGEDDARHLWPYFAECLRVLRPRFALLENVPGHLGLGFGRVLGDLAELGFDAEWECIPAAAVGAPHLRYRVFVVAYANGDSEPGVAVDAFARSGELVPDSERVGLRNQPVSVGGRSGTAVTLDDGAPWHVADTPSARLERPWVFGRPPVNGAAMGDTDRASEDAHPAQGESRGATGESGWWAVEPDVGRVAHGVPSRVDRLRGLGNAVVPQVVQWVGEQLLIGLGMNLGETSRRV